MGAEDTHEPAVTEMPNDFQHCKLQHLQQVEFRIDFSPRTSLFESSQRSRRPDLSCTGFMSPTEVLRNLGERGLPGIQKQRDLSFSTTHTHKHTQTWGHKTCPNEPTINTDLITIGSHKGRQVHKFYLLDSSQLITNSSSLCRSDRSVYGAAAPENGNEVNECRSG